VVSTIIICNQAASAATYRIAVSPAGATAEAKHYIVYGATVADASPAVAAPIVGACGTETAAIELEAEDAEPVPLALVAVTV
jgi:hypothetical protein